MEDNALPQGAEWGWHPRMSSRLGLFRLVQMPGSHEVIFAKTPPKIDHRLLRSFLPSLDDRIPGASAQFFTTGYCRATAANLNLILDNVIQ
jgi:hypothetical protein